MPFHDGGMVKVYSPLPVRLIFGNLLIFHPSAATTILTTGDSRLKKQ